MKRSVVIPLILLMILSLISAQKTTVAQGQAEDVYYFIRSTVTYSNPTGGNSIWNLTEDDRTIGLFMNNSWQIVRLKNSTYSTSETTTDEDGNRIGLLELPKSQLLPSENITFTAEYQITVKPRSIPDISISESGMLDEIPNYWRQTYASAEGPWTLTDVETRNLALEIAGNETNVLKIVTEFIDWIKENIDYGTHEIPLYASQTLTEGSGDCDDQAILLIALLRTLDIPSYLQIGAIYLPEAAEVSQNHWDNHVQIVERKMGWHGWTVVYIPPWGWLPVDLTYVPKGFDDPLNAIRYGAPAGQTIIQYMNVSRVDYISDSLEDQSFLTENGFLVHIEEEMTQVTQNEDSETYPEVTVIIIAVIVVVILLTVFLVLRHRSRQLEQKPL